VNSILVHALKNASLSYGVYYPGTDTDQDNFYADNTDAIKRSDVIVAVLDYTGRDFCFEVGYALALGKKVIPFSTIPVELEERSMMYNHLKSVKDLAQLLQWLNDYNDYQLKLGEQE